MGKIISVNPKFNWLTLTDQKTAAVKYNDISALNTWIKTIGRDPLELRKILGKISSDLNEASMIFKQGSRNWSPDIATKAQAILPDLENLDILKRSCEQAEPLVSYLPDNYPPKTILLHMLHGIQQSRFSDQQIETIKKIAGSGEGLLQPQFVEESDQQRMQNTMQTAIYSSANDSSKTLKVIREVLQNAVDAVIKKKDQMSSKTFIPTIDIKTFEHHGSEKDDQLEKLLDISISDNGIGMDWDTLNDKFFRYFASGKQDDPKATGGFGIAKALIQETPKNGWFIETNGIHSSKFGKNVYMGTPKIDKYVPPQSKIQKNGTGTTLTLLGIPFAWDSSIASLCSQYSTSGVNIILNGKNIKPIFNLSSLQQLDNDLNQLVDTVGKNTLEKTLVKNTIDTIKDKNKDTDANFSEKVWEDEDKQTSLKFLIHREEYGTGQIYVYLNDQFQFQKNEYLNKISLICSVHTNARPTDNQYPVDPGRENLRSPYKEYVAEAISYLKEVLSKISESKIFKAGLDITVYNKDNEPLFSNKKEVDKERDLQYQKDKESFLNAISLAAPNLFTTETTAEELSETVKDIGYVQPLDDTQKAIVDSFIKILEEKGKEKINVQEEVNKILEGISTPASLIVQKDFVGKDVVQQSPELTASIMILWQSIIKKTANKITQLFDIRENKKYIPGIIYTNEALALYLPAQDEEGKDPITLAINPISIAAIVSPELFAERLSVSQEILAPVGQESTEDKSEKVTRRTADKLSTFMFHEAIHEVTHMLWPDYYEGNYEKFHRWITKAEQACHSLYPEIREETKTSLRDIRQKIPQLIKRVSKSRDKAQKQLEQEAQMSNWVKSQCRFSNK